MATRPVQKKNCVCRQHETIQMQLETITKGAVRYREIDNQGNPLRTNDQGAMLATVYIRKEALNKAFGSGFIPNDISVTVTVR